METSLPALRACDSFFAAEANPRPAALCRLAVGFAALTESLIHQRLFVPVAAGEYLRAPIFEWLPLLPSGAVPWFTALWTISAACWAAGMFTSFSGVILFTAILYGISADQNLYSNHGYLMALLVFLLTLARAGSSYSLEALWRGRRHPPIPNWPLVLVKLQISLVYFFTAAGKINPVFLSGDFLAQQIHLPTSWEEHLLMSTIAVVVIAVELFLTFALWLPVMQGSAFLLGFGLHLAIPPAMSGNLGAFVAFGNFSILMVAPYPFLTRDLSRSGSFCHLAPGGRGVGFPAWTGSPSSRASNAPARAEPGPLGAGSYWSIKGLTMKASAP